MYLFSKHFVILQRLENGDFKIYHYTSHVLENLRATAIRAYTHTHT
jgi:hypothetical protein